MTFYDSVISNLKGIVASKKDGVVLTYLDNEYRFITGEYFPLQRLGYNTIYDFIKDHQNLFRIQGTGRYCRVYNMVSKIESDSTLNLISLIQNTNPRNKYVSHQYGNHYNNTSGYQVSNGFYPLVYRPVSMLSWDDIRTNRIDFTKFQRPNYCYMPKKETFGCNKNNVLIPIRCLLNFTKTKTIENIVIILHNDQSIIINKHEVETQTFNEKMKTFNVSNLTFESLELINVIIDIILDTKLIKYNEILNIKIDGDLYHYFRISTGLNVEPILFKDYVLKSIESSKNHQLYGGLISLDATKTSCIFDTKSIYRCNTRLSNYEFDGETKYNVEIVKIFHSNLVAFKVSKKNNPDLHCTKDSIADNTKTIIETQPFWCWTPGSLCLVQLPHYIIKKMNVSSIERAVIIYSEILTFDKESDQYSQPYLIHNTSFYLIDHDVEVEGLKSCASSFRDVKLNSKKSNPTDIALVCNMSESAKNAPPKIQFAVIQNYNDISSSFVDQSGHLIPNTKIVMKSMNKLAYVFHFQFVYSCSTSVCCDAEEPRTLINYKDLEMYQNGSDINNCENIEEYKVNVVKNGIQDIHNEIIAEENKVIEISFNDVAENVVQNNHEQNGISKNGINQSGSVSNNVKENKTDAIVISDSEEEPSDNNSTEISDSCEILTTPYSNMLPRFSPIDLTKFSDSNCEISEFSKESYQLNGFSDTHYTSDKINSDKISILSYSESENDSEFLDSIMTSSKNKDIDVSKHDISLPNSIISYLENNLYPPRKCLRPLTTDIMNLFHGRIVKLLHVQMGSAVIMLFDSIKLIRREIKMMSLRMQILSKVVNVLVGDFFIWRPQKIEDGEDMLVEVMQIVSKTSVLINIVHQGLLAVVNINELFCIPDGLNCPNTSLQGFIGPAVGAFDLHIFPDWFTPVDTPELSNQLYTAFFVDEGKLILEYLDEPCRFLNIEMIGMIEKSLTINHCNVKSGHFIEMLAKSLLQCKLFVGNLLEMMEFVDNKFDDLSITKVLCKVNVDDKTGVWFASVMMKEDNESEQTYEKLSPHHFLSEQFMIDRVIFDDRKQCLRVLDHQNVYVDLPDGGDGLYRFDKSQVTGGLAGSEEFLTRFMLAGASAIPDLKYLYNKLIFNIHF